MLNCTFCCRLFQLREIEWENSGLLLHDRRCDVACFIYDSTDTASFTQVIQLREVLLTLITTHDHKAVFI